MNLEIGQLIDNKTLIEMFGTEKQKINFQKTNTIKGNTKKALLKQLACHCDYTEVKQGRKIFYKIISKHDLVKNVEDRRCNNGFDKVKFTEHLETALALAILREAKKESVGDMDIKGYDYDMPYFTITNSNLMLSAGLANVTYCNYKNKTDKFAEEIGNGNYKQQTIDIAFDKVSNLSKNMHSAINRLSNKYKLITCADCLAVRGDRTESIVVSGKVFTNTSEFKEVWVKGTENYNKAKQFEKMVLEEFGLSNKDSLKFNKGIKKQFDKRLNEVLNKEMGITKIFSTNKITIMKIEWLENFLKERDDIDISYIINSMSAYNILVENCKKRFATKNKSRINKKAEFISNKCIEQNEGFDKFIEENKDILEIAEKEVLKENNDEIEIYEELVKLVVNDEKIIEIANSKCYKK